MMAEHDEAHRGEIEAWLAPDRLYPLRLEPGIRLTALVTRCAVARVEQRADGRHLVYRAGLLFASPSDEQRSQLLLLLRALAQTDMTGPPPLELEVAV